MHELVMLFSIILLIQIMQKLYLRSKHISAWPYCLNIEHFEFVSCRVTRGLSRAFLKAEGKLGGLGAV